MEGEDSSALLDKLTQLLAYVGDEGAKDGYFVKSNNSGNPVYSINIRPEPILENDIRVLVKQIKRLLTKNTPVSGFPQDVLDKTVELKASYDATSSASVKDELINYLSEYANNSGMSGMSGMRGGARKSKRISKSRKNKKTKSRKSAKQRSKK